MAIKIVEELLSGSQRHMMAQCTTKRKPWIKFQQYHFFLKCWCKSLRKINMFFMLKLYLTNLVQKHVCLKMSHPTPSLHSPVVTQDHKLYKHYNKLSKLKFNISTLSGFPSTNIRWNTPSISGIILWKSKYMYVKSLGDLT